MKTVNKNTAIKLIFSGKAKYKGKVEKEGKLYAIISRYNSSGLEGVDITDANVAKVFFNAVNRSH